MPTQTVDFPERPGHTDYNKMGWVRVPERFKNVEWDLSQPGMISGGEVVVDPPISGKLREELTWLSKWNKEDRERFVVLSGGFGSGKTSFAAAVMRRSCGMLPTPRWVRWPRLVADVTASWKSRDYSENDILDQYKRITLIAIDDFGKEIVGGGEMRDWQRRIAFELINSRYESRLPTLITTELDLQSMGERLDKAVTSRIMGDGRWINLGEVSDRRTS